MVYYATMTYTIHQLAKLASVTVRTLHYYDAIGLLKPSFVRPNGYRIYEEKELLQLQQILFFRELEFPLEDIRTMIHAKDFDAANALRDQKAMLVAKRQRLTAIIQTIDIRLKGGEPMTDNMLFGSFSTKQLDEYRKEAKARWGDTNAYKQSEERVKQLSKEDFAHIGEEWNTRTKRLAALMDRGVEDFEVQKLIKEQHAAIGKFYDCSYEMFRNLGTMYVEDERFAKNYEKYRPGMAVFMRDAIAYYCNNHDAK